jgi:hypothetical protein
VNIRDGGRNQISRGAGTTVSRKKVVIGRCLLGLSHFLWNWEIWGKIGNQEEERTPKGEKSKMGGRSHSFNLNQNKKNMTISNYYLHNSR